MYFSKSLIPILKNNPSEAKIKSHQLMLRTGMIKQSSAGIYSWLPLGFKVMKKIEQIVREEQDRIGAQEILMPTIQSSEIWKESGRYDDYGEEMLRIKDRQNRELLYGPTNEELITEIFRSSIKSYKSLPQLMYHIQWKFRDELRPRFGVMRCREFYMKDAYSFRLTDEEAQYSYNKFFLSYLKTFKRLDLSAIPMAADTGPIGGNLSHEFVIIANTGESKVYTDRRIFDVNNDEVALDKKSLMDLRKEYNKYYAVTDEKFNQNEFDSNVTSENKLETKGIEVGHIFYFGDKYSKPMNASVDFNGSKEFVKMGSYGVGVSRLVGGIIEASHDEKGIIWPESVAPFDIAIVNLKPGNVETDELSQILYQAGLSNGHDCLYDESKESAGAKLATMDLIGIPWQLVVGPRGLERNIIELKHRKSGSVTEITPEMAHDFISSQGSLRMPQTN